MSARWSRDNRRAVVAAFRKAGRAAVSDAAEFLLETSNRTAPIEEETLIKSGQVSMHDTDAKAAVSYDTPYAVRQHEELGYEHDPGRRAKWLEATMQEESGTIVAHIGQRMRAVLP